MPQSVGDVVKSSTIETMSEDTMSPLGKAAAFSAKWETASDPGEGGSFRRGMKAVPVTCTTESAPAVAGPDTLRLPVPIAKAVDDDGVGAISHSTSAFAISTTSPATHPLLNSTPDCGSLGSGLLHANSSISLPGVLGPLTSSTTEEIGSSIISGGTPTSSTGAGRGRKPMEGAFKALQTYLSPTYADQDTEFHRLFDQAAVDPPLDRLVYVSACAVNRELLYSGRIYVSQRYICFYSGLFKTLQIVIPFAEIAKLRKEKVLRMMPTAIEVAKRDGERVLFIHVSQRDLVFQVMFELWQNHRSGVTLSSGQLDQKIRQLFGQQPVASSPAAGAVDIRWTNNGSNDDDSIDFLQNSTNSTTGANDSMLIAGNNVAFQTASTSNSSTNSIGPDDDVASMDDSSKNDLSLPSQSKEGSVEAISVDRSGTLRPGSNSNIVSSVATEKEGSGRQTPPNGKPTASIMMKAAATVGTAIALPDGSGSPSQPRRRHREKESTLPKTLVHSDSVQGVEHESAPHIKVARARSRSISGERPDTSSTLSKTTVVAADAQKKPTAVQEPTPTPTPSPSPSEPTPTIPTQFINSPSYPPADFAPCRNHAHLKKCAFDEEIPLAPELLVALIFGPSEAFNALEVRHGALQFHFPPWDPPLPTADSATILRGELPPQLGFTSSKTGNIRLHLGWAVGPRYADLVEKHTVFSETRPSLYYVIERESMAPGMPYGQDFYTVWRYCIRRLPARHPGDKIVRTQMTVTGEVRYRKSIWRAFQGMIERNAQTGIDSFLVILRAALVEECQKYAASAISANYSTPPIGIPPLPETPSVRQAASSGGAVSSTTAEGDSRPTALPLAKTTSSVQSSATQCKPSPSEDTLPSFQQAAQATHIGGASQITTGAMSLSSFSRVDHWLISHPQIAVRTLLVAVMVLLFFTFFLARRVSDVEEHLLRFGLPHRHAAAFDDYHETPNTGRASPLFTNYAELGSVLSQLAQVAGQLSDSLAMLVDAMRSRQLNTNQQGGSGSSGPAGPK